MVVEVLQVYKREGEEEQEEVKLCQVIGKFSQVKIDQDK